MITDTDWLITFEGDKENRVNTIKARIRTTARSGLHLGLSIEEMVDLVREIAVIAIMDS